MTKINLTPSPLVGEGRGEGLKSTCHPACRIDMNGKFLVPQYPSALVPSKKAAFTLAEVLITFWIIKKKTTENGRKF